AAPREIIEHLIAGDRIAARKRDEFLHVLDVEIAHAPGADEAVALQLLKGGERVLQRIASAPMQEIEIDAVDLEPVEARLASGDGASAGGVLRQHLADDEDLLAAALDGFGHDLLGTAIAIHLRGVDQRHAEVEAEPERRDLAVTIASVL